jgi:hypothetical protein
MLRAKTEEVQRLARENAEINRLREEIREIESLRTETRELHKLRNEVRQLREEVQALPGVQGENRRLKNVVASRTKSAASVAVSQPPTTLDQLSYLGLGTPEATVQSFLWAVRQEHIQAFRNCLAPERQKEVETWDEGQILWHMQEMKRQFKGFRIVAKREVSADGVELGLQHYSEDQKEPLKIMLPFKRFAQEWKLDVVGP